MDEVGTTAAVQRYLAQLAGGAPAEPVVRALLDRAVRRLHHLSASLLHRSYPRLMWPPLNLRADELLGMVTCLVSLGTTGVLAPISPVHDEANRCQPLRGENEQADDASGDRPSPVSMCSKSLRVSTGRSEVKQAVGRHDGERHLACR